MESDHPDRIRAQERDRVRSYLRLLVVAVLIVAGIATLIWGAFSAYYSREHAQITSEQQRQVQRLMDENDAERRANDIRIGELLGRMEVQSAQLKEQSQAVASLTVEVTRMREAVAKMATAKGRPSQARKPRSPKAGSA